MAEIVRGASPRPIQNPKWFDSKSDIGWLRISDVTEQNGRVYHLEQRISILGQQKTRVLEKPHLLLSIAATVGKPVMNYVKTGVHDGFLIFLNPKFDKEFLFQWLEMYRPKWQKYGQPGSQVNLNSELVRNQEVAIPEMMEQEKISAFLQQLDATITLHQRKLDALKQMKKGLLQVMFPANGESRPRLRFADFEGNWEQRKLKNVAPLQRGFDLPKDKINVGPYPVVFSNGTGAYHNEYKVLGPGIVTGRSGSIGNVFYIEDNYWPHNTSLWVTNFNGNFPLFIYYLFEKFDLSRFKSGSGVPTLNRNDAHDQLVCYPKDSEQTKVGTFFQQLDRTITLHQEKLDKLTKLKQTYLQKMFI